MTTETILALCDSFDRLAATYATTKRDMRARRNAGEITTQDVERVLLPMAGEVQRVRRDIEAACEQLATVLTGPAFDAAERTLDPRVTVVFTWRE